MARSRWHRPKSGARPLLVVALMLVVPVLASAPRALASATSGATWSAYAADNTGNLVFPLDLANGSVGAGISVGTHPTSLAYSPSGAELYVADAGGTGVQEIATATNTVSTLNPDVGNKPDALAVSPDGSTLWVANYSDATVVPVNTSNGALGTPIALGGGSEPDGIAITPDGSQVLVADYGTGFVSVIKTATKTVTATLNVHGDPNEIVIAPSGDEAFVVDGAEVDLGDISLPLDVLETPITLTSAPTALTITPDGTTAWVAADPGSVSTLTPVAIASNVPGSAVALPTQQSSENVDALAVSSDGATLYAADANIGDVVPMTIATKAFSSQYGPSLAGEAVSSVAVEPDQAPSAAFIESIGYAGIPTSFDASSSSAPVGSISAYSWNFGDGTTETTNAATVSHTYVTSGSYTATLTVTDSAGTSTSEVTDGTAVLRNGASSATTSTSFTVAATPTTSTTTTTTTSTTTTTTTPPAMSVARSMSSSRSIATFASTENASLSRCECASLRVAVFRTAGSSCAKESASSSSATPTMSSARAARFTERERVDRSSKAAARRRMTTSHNVRRLAQ